ncbi:hypothetical protein [Paraburkholderia youngii]|uniref:hypothetical protein n=1 Tax=Paraburkholderia youngii TaxID=2782701 RepID=UPI003D230EA3
MDPKDFDSTDGSSNRHLDLGSTNEIFELLDRLIAEGGTGAVAEWVVRELQPGREVRYARHPDIVPEQAVIYDRSMWRIGQGGEPYGPPVVAALTDENFEDSEIFALWSRPLAKEPFLIRVRTRRSGHG